MARFVSDDYGTRYNVERIAFIRKWNHSERDVDIHFSGLPDDFTHARFRSEDSRDAFLLDVAYDIREELRT